MKTPSSEVKISLLKLLGIFSTLIITTASITVGILVFFVINIDKNKIEELSQKISEISSERKDCENRILTMNANFDEKCDEVLKSEKESFEKKLFEISKNNEDKFNAKAAEVTSLKARLQSQKMNDKLVSESEKILKEKTNFIKQYRDNTGLLQNINKSLAVHEVGCVDLDRLPQGWKYADNRAYWDCYNKKKELTLERERVKDILVIIQRNIDSVNEHYRIIIEKINLH